ncbi:MAG: hypothetical protein AUJ04_03830 [Acidobacteria bacterium 13_1_40CM_3_55_6]|nr:MAG: hypothetical protein AUJ04_03830 [Acidobacteria bacterium 13_1_40CM_3_55_6]
MQNDPRRHTNNHEETRIKNQFGKAFLIEQEAPNHCGMSKVTSENWEQVKELFEAALKREAVERVAFLDGACAGDEALRREVESLLKSYEAAGSFMDAPAVESAAESLLEEPVKLSPGQRMGHYQIINLIGEGGMGEVYLAEDVLLGRKVALKLLPAEFTKDLQRLRRFQQEARAASALNHPNIITIHEIGEVDGLNFIVTEFIAGETLRQRMATARLNLATVLDVATQTAGALAGAHAAGIVHRDLKPENIMVRPDGLIKVLDFGLAKLTEPGTSDVESEARTVARVDTKMGAIMGTAQYMSPEQARGLKVDARTDIFSLGVVLYEMLAGRAPFVGETTADTISVLLHKEPQPLSTLAPDTPADLQHIVSKTLRKDKDERYQTVKSLLVDLKSLKQRLEFEIELERSAPASERAGMEEFRIPASSGRSGEAKTSPPEGSTLSTRPASSVEYLIGGIKQHKRGAALALAVLLLAIGIGYWVLIHRSSSVTTIQSIAVLPFENQNHDPDTDYLSDGLTENIINNLTQLPSLRVIPRSSVFHYKGRETDSMTAGRELGVRAVLTGRIMQRGDNLVVSAELVDIRDNKQLWGEQYSRKVSDALALQQEISRQISERLRLKLTGEDQKQLNKGGTNDAEAYQFYMKGRYYWNKRGASGSLQKAIDQFQQAVQKDPNYALAYVGLADSYGLLEEYTGDQGIETLQKARAFAERALQIDNSLAEAHSALALAYEVLWLWDDAEREYRLSISLNPNYPTAHHWHGEYLLWMGRDDEGLAELKRAQELDPLSLVINMWLAETYFRKGDTDAAIKQSNKVLELDRDFPRSHRLLGIVYLRQGRYEEAIAELQKGTDLSGRASGSLADLGYAYGVWGQPTEAVAIIKELEQKYARHETHAWDIAAVYSGLGDRDQAFAWLEKDFRAHSTSLPAITIGNSFDSLRNDPRYADLLRRMGLRS